MPNPPLAPKIELTLITDPLPDAFKASPAAFIPRKTLVWVTAIVRS